MLAIVIAGLVRSPHNNSVYYAIVQTYILIVMSLWVPIVDTFVLG